MWKLESCLRYFQSGAWTASRPRVHYLSKLCTLEFRKLLDRKHHVPLRYVYFLIGSYLYWVFSHISLTGWFDFLNSCCTFVPIIGFLYSLNKFSIRDTVSAANIIWEMKTLSEWEALLMNLKTQISIGQYRILWPLLK